MSDSQGGVYNIDGIDPVKAEGIKSKAACLGAIVWAQLLYRRDEEPGWPCHPVTNEELLELDVDVLIPAALENQITKENADRIKAPVILELANGGPRPTRIRFFWQKCFGGAGYPEQCRRRDCLVLRTGSKCVQLLLD